MLIVAGDDVAAPFIAALHAEGDVAARGAQAELIEVEGGRARVDGAIEQIEVEGVEEAGVAGAALG